MYALAWSPAPYPRAAPSSAAGIVGARLAIGSFVEETHNEVQVLGVREAHDGSG